LVWGINQTVVSKTPSHIVYHVCGHAGSESFWTRIGATWAHKDGNGFNIQTKPYRWMDASLSALFPKTRNNRLGHLTGRRAKPRQLFCLSTSAASQITTPRPEISPDRGRLPAGRDKIGRHNDLSITTYGWYSPAAAL